MKAWLEALGDANFGPKPTGAGRTQERWGDATLHNACSSLESAGKNGSIPRGSFEPLSNSQFVKTGEAGYASPIDTTKQSQRTQEVQQILLRAGTEVFEILLYGIGFAAVAGMGIDRLKQASRAAIVEQEDPLPETPQGCGVELVAAGASLGDVVRQTCPHVMDLDV